MRQLGFALALQAIWAELLGQCYMTYHGCIEVVVACPYIESAVVSGIQ